MPQRAAVPDAAVVPPPPGESLLQRLEAPVGVVLVLIAAAMSAVIEVMLVPLYIGTVIFPIAILLAIASNIGLPILARWLVDSVIVAALPVLVWIALLLMFSQHGPGGDVLLPGGGALSAVTYVSYGVMLGGLTAGVITVVRGESRTSLPF